MFCVRRFLCGLQTLSFSLLFSGFGRVVQQASGPQGEVKALSGQAAYFVLEAAHALRDGGLGVEYALAPQALGKQLKLGDARGARLAVVIGPDDRAQGAVMASDAFFPFADGIEAAAEHGIAAVVQPGGSMRDDEVIAAVNKLGLVMAFTETRHFRH